MWLWFAAICAGLSVLSFVLAYLTHQHDAIAVGAILGVAALIGTVFSAIIGWIVWIGGGLLLVCLVWLGWKLRHISVVEWLKSRKGKSEDATKQDRTGAIDGN